MNEETEKRACLEQLLELMKVSAKVGVDYTLCPRCADSEFRGGRPKEVCQNVAAITKDGSARWITDNVDLVICMVAQMVRRGASRSELKEFFKAVRNSNTEIE